MTVAPNSDAIPRLETERLVMRGWRLDDAGPMAEIYGDETLARYIGGQQDPGSAWSLMAAEIGHWHLRGYGMWVLEIKDGAPFAGFAGLWEPGDWPELEMGWVLARAFHGKGYATEAAERARRYAYEELKAETLVSYIHPDNEPSKRVAHRLGAVHEQTITLRGHAAEVFRHPGPRHIN